MLDPTSLLRTLVRIPSINDLRPCQQQVAAEMQRLGLEVTTYASDTVADSRLPNVIGRRRGSPDRHSLLLVAHADTVPHQRSKQWHHDPFEAAVEDGRMFGRGVYDDKAGIVLMLAAAERFLAGQPGPTGDLILASMADDESSGKGFHLLADQGVHPDACLMLDGAKLHQVVYGHAGCVWYRLEVFGTPVACNNRGHNAIEKSLMLLSALTRLADGMNTEIVRPYGAYARPIRLNISRINGGEWLGNNAVNCVSEFSLNFVAPEDVTSVSRRIEAAVQSAGAGDEWLLAHPPLLRPVHMAFDPYEAPLDGPFYAVVRRCHQEVAQRDLEPRVATGWYHGATFGCPCYLYGPGDGGHPHGANEFFELRSFDVTIPAVARMIEEWTGQMAEAGDRPRARAAAAPPVSAVMQVPGDAGSGDFPGASPATLG